jgi:hypothetical protein
VDRIDTRDCHVCQSDGRMDRVETYDEVAFVIDLKPSITNE